MAKQYNYQAPATNMEPSDGTTRNSTYYFSRPVVPGMMPPVGPQTFQPANGGLFSQSIPFYSYWTPSPMAFSQQPSTSTAPSERNDNIAQPQNQSQDSSHERPASTPTIKQESSSDPMKDEEDLKEFMPKVRKHLRKLDGSQLREIILSVCLNSSTVYRNVVSCVKQKEANEKIVVDHGSEGLGLHLQYFRIGELETLIARICEYESTSTRRTIKYLILAIGEQKELQRDKQF
ncbi:hypothetical protein M434DRAFT_37016 [Hypoxylon sp. CO27-5]|nr:hypothetical protein M434DRAFT_37016 [Hypoxylon sp. CO27-5]